jgi:GR25 family glycosyltransferase involved in LPS biosynthesis
MGILELEIKSLTDRPPRGLNEVFPYKVCINLDRRADRWDQMQAKFQQHNLQDIRRFSAVDGQGLNVPGGWSATSGAYGCLLSHLQVVRDARELGIPSVLIFEDDVVFDANLQDNFRRYIGQAPADWDMLYFGALQMDDPIEVSRNVCRLRRAYSTYAYALNSSIFDAFIDLNGRAEAAVDINNLRLQKDRKCYCFTPHLAWVEHDYSDAQERQKNHWYLQESLVINGSGMDHLLGRTAVILAHKNSGRDHIITQNLLFLARFYTNRLPGIGVVIVEQDREPTIEPASLPKGCQYILAPGGGPLDRGLCFNAGMNILPPEREYLIFSDSDLFVEEWDICANLRMCERYDCTTGFGSIVELTRTDTLHLHRDESIHLRWFDSKKYSSRSNGRVFSKYSVFNRGSIETIGGWEERRPEDTDPLLAPAAIQSLEVFESPNQALHMYHE